MTYVREQTSAELAAHMRSLKKMPGWFEPLADRLWQEVEILKAENERLHKLVSWQAGASNEVTISAGQLMKHMDERDQLKAENEALRKNSDRYQWLRDKSESVHPFYLSTPVWFTGVRFRKEDVDSSIDAAMISVATQSTDNENVSRHEGGQT